MIFRKRIILIITIIGLVVTVGAQESFAANKKKILVLNATKKISVKHSRSKDQSTIGELSAKVEKAVSTQIKEHTLKVEASAYTLCKGETDGTPNISATGKQPVPRKTCAVSRDLKKRLLGKTIMIPNLGVVVVNDIMKARYRNSIDIVFGSKKEANDFGRKDVIIVVLN